MCRRARSSASSSNRRRSTASAPPAADRRTCAPPRPRLHRRRRAPSWPDRARDRGKRRMIRKLELLVVAVVLVVAAFSTAEPFLFYLLYLAILVIGGSYVLVRLGLTDLEAGYAVSQLHGHVGDRMRVPYPLRNSSRLPKPWLEIHNPTTLPGGLPGRAITLGGHAERSWLIRAPLTRRGHFRIEPLHIRTGDPFGF